MQLLVVHSAARTIVCRACVACARGARARGTGCGTPAKPLRSAHQKIHPEQHSARTGLWRCDDEEQGRNTAVASTEHHLLEETVLRRQPFKHHLRRNSAPAISPRLD